MSEELKYRLNQLEASPPPGTWDNISSAIDEWKECESLSKKLQEAAVIPPPGNWEQIDKRLQPPIAEIKKPFRKVAFKLYQVAASLIIVALLISGGWKLYNSFVKNSMDPDERNLQNASISKNSLLQSLSIDIQKSTKREKINAFLKNNILVRNPGSVNDNPLYSRAINYKSIEGSRWLTKETPIVIDAGPIESDDLELMHKTILANGQDNNYLYIKDSNGQTMRVSVKFAELINYLFHDDASININSGDGKNWGQLITEWREKIIRSGYIPASDNFLDIVEFNEFLRKNQ
jgi:hypothetical protein